MTEKLEQYLNFIKETQQLKSVLRTAWTADKKQESTAEHSWRLALFAGVLADEFPELDKEKVLMMCLIHDIGELYAGDISAASEPDKNQKHQEEYKDAQKVFSLLPAAQRDKMTELWKDYNENKTPEAHLVKALDKAETIIQHNQGANEPDFNYEFNLTYGKEYFTGNGILTQLRNRLDEETALHINAAPYKSI